MGYKAQIPLHRLSRKQGGFDENRGYKRGYEKVRDKPVSVAIMEFSSS